MDWHHWSRLRQNWQYLRENLSLEEILPLLYQDRVVSQSDQERIKAEVTTAGKVEKFLFILKTRQNDVFYKLCTRLEQTEQAFISKKLKSTKPDEEDAERLSIDDKIGTALLRHFYECKDSFVPLEEVQRIVSQQIQQHLDQTDLEKAISDSFVQVRLTKQSNEEGQQANRFINLKQKISSRGKGKAKSKGKVATVSAGLSRRSQRGRTSSEDSKRLQDMDTEELCQCLLPLLTREGIQTDILDVLKEEEINGKVFQRMTTNDTKELFPKLKFGKRKTLIIIRDDIVEKERSQQLSDGDSHSEMSELHEPCSPFHPLYRETFRRFDTASHPGDIYRYGSSLVSGVTSMHNMIEPVHKYGWPSKEQEGNLVAWIAQETITFGSACMNSRTNGTIHFGIKQIDETDDGKGEVLGLNVDKQEIRDGLKQAIDKCFFAENHSQAFRCIREVQFVDVTSPNDTEPVAWVIEVDIVPHSKFTQTEAFFVNLQPYGGEEVVFVAFMKGTLMQLNQKMVSDYMKERDNLKDAREKQEKDVLLSQSAKPDLREKFVDLLTGGVGSMTDDLYPIIFTSPLPSNMDEVYIKENLDFISAIDANAVFDFDPVSDTKGLFNFMENDQGQMLKALTTENFDRNGEENRDKTDRFSALLDDLTVSSNKPWIFCNGYVAMNKTELDPLQWKRTRSEGCKEAIRFYRDEIPEGRAIVIFFLFSKNYDQMLEAADEVMVKFQHQWMVVAQSEEILMNWKRELLRRQSTDEKTLNERAVIGLQWKQVSDTVHQIMKTTSPEAIELPTSSGAFCPLQGKIKNEMFDLEILSRCQCDNAEIIKDPVALSRHRRQVEEQFFRGGEVQWWNFWFKDDHVLRREKHNKLVKKVEQTLDGDIDEDDKVGIVRLYHQPGAGGSTTARHVLWEMKSDYRCCVLKQISEDTCEQITNFRGYKDQEESKPVIVLVDNQDEEKVNRLYSQLEDKARLVSRNTEKPFKVFCVLLLCVRRTGLPSSREGGKYVLLPHDLEPQEIEWFKRKNEVLEKTHQMESGVDPRLLISFNIMKENFDQSYMKRTVKAFYDDINRDHEKVLLQFLALLNTYDIDFQPLPVSAFDNLMQTGPTISFGLYVPRRFKHAVSWESSISQSLKVLLNMTSRAGLGSGHLKGLRVVNQLLAREILDYILSSTNKTTSDLIIELLGSDIIHRRGMPAKELNGIVKDVLKKRPMQPNGGKQDFSNLVTEIKQREGTDRAAEVLKKGFEETDDPMIAQQVSRFFIHCKNWSEAVKYAKMATLKIPKNSYLWDTYAHVYKSQMFETFNQCALTGDRLEDGRSCEIIDIAFEAISKYREEQKLSEAEKHGRQNTNGYFGEIRVVTLLLQLFNFFSCYPGEQHFHRFLVQQRFVPTQLRFLEDDRIQKLKLLQVDVDKAVTTLEEKQSQVKDDGIDIYGDRQQHVNKENLAKLKGNLDNFFGEESDEAPPNLPKEEQNAFHRRRIRKLGGRSLTTLLDLRFDGNGEQKLASIATLAEKNLRLAPKAQDYMTLLGAAIARKVLRFEPKSVEYHRLLDLSEQLYDLTKKDERPYLESILFMVLFHWPTEARKKYQLCSINKIQEAMRRWKNAFYSNHPRQRDDGQTFRRKDKTFFFLGKSIGGDPVQTVYYQDLHDVGTTGKHIRGDKVWWTEKALTLLDRLQGTLVNDGTEISIQVESSGGNKSVIAIPTSLPIGQKYLWQKRVFFVLGFGWSGPRAYNITREDPSRNRQTDSNWPYSHTHQGQEDMVNASAMLHRARKSDYDVQSRNPPQRQLSMVNKLKQPDVMMSIESFNERLKGIEQKLEQLRKKKKDPWTGKEQKAFNDLLDEKKKIIETRSALFGERYWYVTSYFHS